MSSSNKAEIIIQNVKLWLCKDCGFNYVLASREAREAVTSILCFYYEYGVYSSEYDDYNLDIFFEHLEEYAKTAIRKKYNKQRHAYTI